MLGFPSKRSSAKPLVERDQSNDCGGHHDNHKDGKPRAEHAKCRGSVRGHILCRTVRRELCTNLIGHIGSDSHRYDEKHEHDSDTWEL